MPRWQAIANINRDDSVRLVKAHTFNLSVALCNQPCLVLNDASLLFRLFLEYPFGSYDICVARACYQCPNNVLCELLHLFLHDIYPCFLPLVPFQHLWANLRNIKRIGNVIIQTIASDYTSLEITNHISIGWALITREGGCRQTGDGSLESSSAYSDTIGVMLPYVNLTWIVVSTAVFFSDASSHYQDEQSLLLTRIQ